MVIRRRSMAAALVMFVFAASPRIAHAGVIDPPPPDPAPDPTPAPPPDYSLAIDRAQSEDGTYTLAIGLAWVTSNDLNNPTRLAESYNGGPWTYSLIGINRQLDTSRTLTGRPRGVYRYRIEHPWGTMSNEVAVSVNPGASFTVSVDAPDSLDGTYTISWVGNLAPWKWYFEESVNGAPWQYQDICGLGGDGTITCISSYPYANKPVGRYRYRIRAADWTSDDPRISNEVAVVVGSQQVGVIPGGSGCANGAAPLEIKMDDEDSFGSSSTSGWTGAIYSDPRHNTHFRFCGVDGRQFKPLTTTPDQVQEYAVIKLGDWCPNGSVEFGRYFDNQDGYTDEWLRWIPNENWNSGGISPNWQDPHGTMLRFCLFRYGPDTLQDGLTGQIGWPNIGFTYGVFAGQDFPAAAGGLVHTDDEDSNTASSFDIPPSLDVSSVYRIVEGYPHSGGNTELHTAQVRYQ